MTYQLPPELERIVKAYAKPAFVHWRLFKEAKQAVPKRHWTDLEQALSVRDAENVCQSLTAYVNAYRDQELASNALSAYMASIGDTGISYWCHETQSVIRSILTPEQSAIKNSLCDAGDLARANEFKAYRALLVAIHGEPTVEYAEYLDRRRARYGWSEYADPLTLQDWSDREDDE